MTEWALYVLEEKPSAPYDPFFSTLCHIKKEKEKKKSVSSAYKKNNEEVSLIISKKNAKPAPLIISRFHAFVTNFPFFKTVSLLIAGVEK